MKLRWMVIAVAVALVGCRGGERAAVTGSYGSGVVSGEVVMAAGGSPAGVEVSLRGTGMTTTLGADGKFAFGGVPEGAQMDFRRSDGIEAALQLDALSTNMVIELAQSSAKKASSRRRSVGGGGTKYYQFEGVIRSATAEQIVVFTSKKQEVTIAMTPQTVIRKGNSVLTVADLLVDARVHVKAQGVGTGYTALEVKLQEGEDDDGDDDQPSISEYEGIVVSASAAQLVMTDSHRREVTFAITAQTDIRKGNTPVLPADIQPGWRVHVKAATGADGVLTATRVIVQNTKTEDDVKLSGVVTAVGTADLKVGDTTVQTNASTKIRKRGATIALADVHAGDRVKVEGTSVAANTVLAKEIEVKSE